MHEVESGRAASARSRHFVDGPTDKEREYLEVIYYLSARKEPIISARLADWMKVKAPTVTNIVQRMERKSYITRNERGEIALTPEGFVLAEAMVKRHRVLERFLVDVLGIPWHAIHEEAVRLEHALSPLMEARIEALVGHANTCPHGNPIPGNSDGYNGSVRLDDVPAGRRFTVSRIVEEAEEDSELMRYMQNHDIVPGSCFIVANSSPTYGVTLSRSGKQVTLSPEISSGIWGEMSAG